MNSMNKRELTCAFLPGQVGLVVVLIGAVLATIGLGVASQSVLEIKTARQETVSSEAFNAAEQGIEQVLQGSDPDATINGYRVSVQTEVKTDTYQGIVLTGRSVQLNLAGVNEFDLSWTDLGTCASAVVVTLINSTGTTLTRHAYGRTNCEGFETPDLCNATSCAVNKITVPVGTALARIKAVKSDTELTASLRGTNLQTQYTVINSIASQALSGETRAVEVTKLPAAAPSIFDYALFVGEGAL